LKWADSVILSWGVAYLACSVIKPDIGLDKAVMLAVGGLMIAPLILQDALPKLSKVLFFIMGCFEAVGVVASWTSFIVWNVPVYGNRALFQVSMAVMDWVAAVALFSKVVESWSR